MVFTLWFKDPLSFTIRIILNNEFNTNVRLHSEDTTENHLLVGMRAS